MFWIIGVVGCSVALLIAWYGSRHLGQLLLAFLFASPLVPTAFGYPLSESGIIVSPTRVLGLLLMSSFAIAATRKGVLRRGFPLTGVLLLFLSVRAAGIVVSADRPGAVIQLVGEAGLFTALLAYLAFCVIRNRQSFEKLVTTLLVCGFFISLSGLWEWATKLNFSAYVMIPLAVGARADDVAIATKAGGLPRIMGTLDHPLALAGLMVFLFPFALQRAITRLGGARLLYLSLLGLFAASLFLSFERAAQVAAVVGTFVIGLVYWKRGLSWVIAGTVATGALALVWIYGHTTEPITGSSLLLPVETLRFIAARWVDLGGDLLSHPVALAVGFGYVRFDATATGVAASEFLLRYSRMDSDIIRVLAVTGVLGFVSWLGVFFVFLKRVQAVRRRNRTLFRQPAAVALAVAVSGCLLTALPGVSVLTYTQTWPVIAAFIGAALGTLQPAGGTLGRRRVLTREPGSLPRPNEVLGARHA